MIDRSIHMPKEFDKLVKGIRKSCEASGKYSHERCQDISYGAATNIYKRRHGRPP